MKFSTVYAAFLGLAMMTSCNQAQKEDDTTMDEEPMEEPAQMEEPAMATAMASLSGKNGSDVSGSITFTQVSDSTVKMEIEVMHLAPGEHAIHLHEKGDCSADDGTSAGGHWNPTNEEHGHRGVSEQYHKGDIINLTSNSDSTATATVEVKGWTIGGDMNSNIVDHAVIIHAMADDFTSQPSGAAGDRVACGVIKQQ